MAALSHKISTTSTQKHPPLDLASAEPVTLSQASYFEGLSARPGDRFIPVQPSQDRKQSVGHSTTTSATFSSLGNRVPDEIHDEKSDMDDIRRVATLLALRRGVSPESLVPTVMDLYGSQSSGGQVVSGAHTPSHSPNMGSPDHGQRIERVRSRPRPTPLKLNHERHFSFDRGDDLDLNRTGTHTLPTPTTRPLLLRQSVSLCQMGGDERAVSVCHYPALKTPIAALPSVHSSSSTATIPLPALSKIPSPKYGGSLARPRQERDDSTSSLLTAIKYADDDGSSRALSRRSITSVNLSTSEQNSPCVVTSAKRDSSDSDKTTPGQRLVEEKQQLRNNLAIAAMRTAGNLTPRSPTSDNLNVEHTKRSRSQLNASTQSRLSRTCLESNQNVKENVSPR